MKPLRSSLAIILAAGLSANAQTTTATTDPVGFAVVEPAAGTVSISPGFVEAALFQGPSTASTSGNTFSGSFTPGSLAPTVQGYPSAYVQVTSSGDYQGFVFDIASVNAEGDIVSSDAVPVALNNQSVQIVVRPHFTLNKLISGATGLTDYADVATFINSDGSLKVCIYAEGSWLADDYITPIGDLPIYPGTGFTFTSSGAAKLTTIGSVQTSPVAVPLYAGVPNLVNQMNPGSAVKLQNLQIASVMTPYSDAFNNFSATGNMSIAGTYYSDGTQLLDSNYEALPENASDSVAANGAIAVTTSGDAVWKAPAPTIAP